MTPRALLRTLAILCAASALACGRRAPSPAPREEAPAAPPAEAPPAQESRAVKDGLAIAFTLRPAAGAGAPAAFADATVEFTITDAATGAPVRGLAPLGWMSLRRDGAALDEAACRAKIKSLMAGLLSVRPEVDMNDDLLWTLNEDSSLSAINPQVAFSRTKLRSVISLAAPGVSFALHPDRESLYVTLGGGHGLAVVDTRRGLVRQRVPVGEDPARVAVSPDGRAVWVGNDGDGTVSVLDARSGDLLRALRVGPGHHEFAFTGGGRLAWITSQGGASVAVVDGVTIEPLGDVDVGEGAVSITASDEAGAVYVARERGEVVLLDAARRAVAGRIALRPGLGTIRFDPRGRFAFALNPAAGEVAILDAARAAVAHTLRGFASPDEVVFTEAYAYVRNRGAGSVSLIDRAALGGPAPPPVAAVQIGQRAPVAAPDRALAVPIAPSPDGRSVLVASPADRAIYYYAEGMMAPMGTLSIQGRAPRSILVEDRSLQEVRPGVYAAPVRLGPEGEYDVELLLDRPRAAVCLEASVAPSPAGGGARPGWPEDPALTVEPLFDPDVWLEAGAPATLRFRAAVPAEAPPLTAKEMQFMVLRLPTGYRWSGAPRAEADGTFSITVTPPSSGQYRVLAAAPGRGAPFGALPDVPLRVFGEGAAGRGDGGAR